MKTYRFTIKGRVQGVYYRKSVQERALKENFLGYVKNLPNKDVEAVANLDSSNFNRFVEILEEGSPLSHAKEITKEEMEPMEFNSFEIRYSA